MTSRVGRRAELKEELSKPDIRLREELHAETLSSTTVEDAADRVRAPPPAAPPAPAPPRPAPHTRSSAVCLRMVAPQPGD